MTEPLAPQFEPNAIAAPIAARWAALGVGHADESAPGDPFVIMMPPPNVTAILHAGHGLNNTIQDVLIRFERMRGRQALWLPGTDHAGIATQNVVEKQVAKEGLTRFDVGREAFEKRIWEFVGRTGGEIFEQLRGIGSSCDWERAYFTLDPSLSRAVREVFVRLFEDGLIYRGKYLINWCPRCGTALSNEEAEKVETDGRIWRLRYPLADGSGHVTVATTRPETMLGDVAVVVHPDDPRYRDLVGRTLRLPLVDRLIPIIADDAVDPAFGTGAVKVTPAHDATDFDIGRRHDLEQLDVMTDTATMNDTVPERFRGLDRFDARKQIVAEFDGLGLLEAVDAHTSAVGHCYRCDTIIEPRLSNQWFVRMQPLAEPALQAYRDGKLTFVPEHRGEEYAQWMGNIRDWCISRQLWWGHRIPVFYCEAPACGTTTASRTDLTACPACGGAVRQDDDVLDTWFSSWLVPFSALGWPDQTPSLAKFYPGHVLVTAPEILFFWVARMIMAGCRFMGEVPFSTIYLHGTARDTLGRKMSKSLGNGIDPLEVTALYGADALRYTLVAGLSVGTDVILDPKNLETSFAPGRNFANKLWNAGRFVLSNVGADVRPLAGSHADVVRREELTLADRWILARCDATVVEVTRLNEKLRLNDAAGAVYQFLWGDLADWYIEQVKPRLSGQAEGGDVARAVLVRTFETALRLLHPVMPFITEALWQRLPRRRTDVGSIAVAEWPRQAPQARDEAACRDFALVQQVIGAVRQIRAEYGIQPGTTVRAFVVPATAEARAALAAERGTVERLAKVNALALQASDERVGGNAVLPDGTAVFVPLGDAIDLGRECARLGEEFAKLTGLAKGLEGKLANEQFVARAPAAVVQTEREKLVAWREQAAVLAEKRRLLGCA